MSSETPTPPLVSPPVVERLVGSHREFLAFLTRRISSREAANEILQSAFVRTIEKGDQLREPDAVVSWFYRLLRNSIVDYYRRHAVETRIFESGEPPSLGEDPELHRTVCTCVGLLIPNLKEEYAAVLREVDLEERSIADVAASLGISTNNATVRLHRARQALKRELERSCGTCATHGCLDCSCAC